MRCRNCNIKISSICLAFLGQPKLSKYYRLRVVFENRPYSYSRLVVCSVTPFKIDQNKKSKPFNRLSPESGNRKKVHIQRLSPRFRLQQFFSWKICEETFSPNL